MSRDFAKLPSHIMRDVYDELGSISEEAGEDQKKIKSITGFLEDLHEHTSLKKEEKEIKEDNDVIAEGYGLTWNEDSEAYIGESNGKKYQLKSN